MMGQTNNSKLSPDQKYASNPPYITNMVPANRRATALDGGHYTKICGMWTLNHEISSKQIYELLIKT